MTIWDKIFSFVSSNGRSGTIKRNILASFAIKGVSMVVSFSLVPLTIGYVSSELYGVWLTLSSILTWLSFFDIGFSKGLKNKLTEAIANDDWKRGKSLVSTTYFMMVVIFLPVCCILEIVIPFINWSSLLNVDVQFTPEIIKAMHILIAMACLQMVVNVFSSVVAAFQKVALSNAFQPVGNLISLVIIYILTKTCPPSLSVLALTLAAMPILVTLCASIAFFFGKFKRVSPSFTSISKDYVKDLFGLGYKFFIIEIQVLVLYQSTNILISNVSSPNEVTTYNIAYKLMSLAIMIYTTITAPLWPAYTDAYAKKDYQWMKAMRKKMKRILGIAVFSCFIVTLLSPWIYQVWIGDTTHVPFIMTTMVALYVSVYCWMSLNGTLIVGMGKVAVETCIVIIGMFVHIPLSLYLGQYIGAYGVLTSLVLINLFYAVVMNIQVNKLLNMTATGIWNK